MSSRTIILRLIGSIKFVCVMDEKMGRWFRHATLENSAEAVDGIVESHTLVRQVVAGLPLRRGPPESIDDLSQPGLLGKVL
jgi:hypothetical protein